MKNKILIRNLIGFMFLLIIVVFIQSCAVYSPNTAQMVTVPDIIQMSKNGVSSKDIIKDIRRSHTVYGLKADQLAKLRDQGVQDSVINYMEKTHMDAIAQNQWRQDYWWPGYDGYWYGGFGWPYYGGFWGWNWGWGPSIVFNYRGGFHGGEGGFHGGHGFHGGRH